MRRGACLCSYTVAPDAPTKVAANLYGRTLSWVAPFDGGASISSFLINCTSTNGGAPLALSTKKDSTTYTFSLTGNEALSTAKTFTCTVAAENGAGADVRRGPPSASSLAFT